MDGVQNSRIENNLLYDNHASGISLYRIDGGGGSTGNVVVNNTIHVAEDGRWALNIQDGSTDNTAFNNILVSEHPTRGAIDISADSRPGFTSDYNVVIPKFSNDDTFISLAQWRTANRPGRRIRSLPNPNRCSRTGRRVITNCSPPPRHATLASNRLPRNSLRSTTWHGKTRPLGAAFDIGAYEFVAPTLDGDFNHDGTVDAADYTVWRDGQGTQDDYLLWKSHFGESVGSASLADLQNAVPEPATAVLLASLLAWRSASAAAFRRVNCRSRLPQQLL